MKIVIPGGSGQVGRILARHFAGRGWEVTPLGRDTATWASAIDGADLVINLAGRSVNCRYTAVHRREIMDSRTATTAAIGRAISQAARPPRLWLNASTATIYRHALDRPMDEATGDIGDPAARWGFSIQVATRWEKTLFDCPTPQTRKVAMRSAITLSPDRGGIFDVLLGLVRHGLGGAAGSGNQYVSWVHEADFVRAVEFLIAREDLSGAINIASPNPLPNREFMRELRRAWGTSIGLPATGWMLAMGALFLRTETELILKSRRVIPSRLLDAGFAFEFPDWCTASRDLVGRWRN